MSLGGIVYSGVLWSNVVMDTGTPDYGETKKREERDVLRDGKYSNTALYILTDRE